jgi:hypothetical protein
MIFPQWDVCNALQNVDTIRLTKHLMLFPRYIESGPGGRHGKMVSNPYRVSIFPTEFARIVLH